MKAWREYIHNTIEAVNLRTLEPRKLAFLFGGWLVSFYLFFIALETDTNWKSVWVVFNAYFWFRSNRYILGKLRLRTEYLLFLILIFYIPAYFYLNLRLKHADTMGLDPVSDILQAIIIFLLGLVFVINHPSNRDLLLNEKPGFFPYHQRTLIFYFLLALLAFILLRSNEPFYYYLLVLFILLALLNKTTWLDNLNRRELWIYFFVFLSIYTMIGKPSGFSRFEQISSSQITTWYIIPYYVHLLVKLYFLAMVIKIPAVMIYNHASLARKLRIASLFQSSIPQFIQFLFLVAIFFFFVAGWQAENVKKSILNIADHAGSNHTSNDLDFYQFPVAPDNAEVQIPGYLPYRLPADPPMYSVVRLARKNQVQNYRIASPDYFLMYAREDGRFFFPLDKTFAQVLARNLTLIAGSGIIMYPFRPQEWQNFIYDFKLLQENTSIRIYPFGFLSLNESWAITTPFQNTLEDSTNGTIIIFGNDQWVAGRVYLPILNAGAENDPLFAFDVYIRPSFSFIDSAMVRIFIALVILYLLLSTFVIGRLGKFGTDIHHLIVQKFELLKRGIRQIANGNLDYKFRISGEDEFVELAGHFNEMGDKLKATIAEARDRDRLDHELKIARQVQQSLLPSGLPGVPGYEIAASLTTANEIGGDFYDILPLDKNRYLFAIGDVSGKGSSAAFYMAQFISLLRFSPQFTDDPAEIAKRLNDYFANQIIDRQIFITAIIGILDYKQNFVKFIRAGHTPPVIIPADPNQSIREIESDGLGIGLTRTVATFKKSLEERTIKMKSGDVIVFYTDGVVEAARESEPAGKTMKTFGEEKFREILGALKGQPAVKVLDRMRHELAVFYGDTSPVDDYTLFILGRTQQE